MYKRRTKGAKKDQVKRWALPDKVFFACGACHILAHIFLERYPDRGFKPIWIKPKDGYTGNHIVVASGNTVFDYHGYSKWDRYWKHTVIRANQWWPGWDANTIVLPKNVLISEKKSKKYAGLWLREPSQFLNDPIPRAKNYLHRFSDPRSI